MIGIAFALLQVLGLQQHPLTPDHLGSPAQLMLQKAATASDSLRQSLSMIRLSQMATARDEYRGERSAIAMPVFSGGGRVAAAIELTARDPATDLKAAASALAVACRSLSRQLATELRDHAAGTGNGTTATSPA